ncbi:mediator of RNA polymerase II transcription subunit 31 isoform X2 [Planococcus citri]|uniref:mediator of RNA polymerase II transcription subunit 31 isoform X2 n=1 Tax=Planococcus citri TaxID=170843 RepID=UPI0031F92A62
MSGPETEDQARVRFQIELEFVQCLGNPHYLNFLAQRGYFKDSSFINYLKYLLYWKESDYAKYIKYPICLYFLDLLQYEHFRREIVNGQCAKFIDDQVLLLWQHYTRRRTKFLQTAMESHALAINSNANVNGNMNGNASHPIKNNGPPLLHG